MQIGEGRGSGPGEQVGLIVRPHCAPTGLGDQGGGVECSRVPVYASETLLRLIEKSTHQVCRCFRMSLCACVSLHRSLHARWRGFLVVW